MFKELRERAAGDCTGVPVWGYSLTDGYSDLMQLRVSIVLVTGVPCWQAASVPVETRPHFFGFAPIYLK
jgi:hypothetical protein